MAAVFKLVYHRTFFPYIWLLKTAVFLLVFFLHVQTARAQETSTERDTHIEQSYSPDMANLILITEQSRSSEWNLKNSALALMSRLLTQNKRNPEILSALEFLALEGTVNKKRVNGKTINSYPDIRAKTATCLGDYGGEDAKKILILMLKVEIDTMVLAPVVYALSKIGITAEDEIILNDMIRRVNTGYPDNFLAIAYLDALEKYGEERSDAVNIATRQCIYQISQGVYAKPVRKKAQLLLKKLNSYRETSHNGSKAEG